MAPRACNLCGCTVSCPQESMFGLMLCWHHLEIPDYFGAKGPVFHFALSSVLGSLGDLRSLWLTPGWGMLLVPLSPLPSAAPFIQRRESVLRVVGLTYIIPVLKLTSNFFFWAISHCLFLMSSSSLHFQIPQMLLC